VIQTARIKWKMFNEGGPSHVMDVVGEARSEDTWIKTNVGWQEKKAVTRYMQTLVDGEWNGRD